MDDSQPGVEAFGYVNKTTPFLLSSTNFINVVFSPSFVSTSPPKPARVMVSPTATLAFVDDPLDTGLLSVIVDLALEAVDLTELAFFIGGGGALSEALRLRSSTIARLFRSFEENLWLIKSSYENATET